MKPSERILDRATELKRITEKMDLDRGEIRVFDPMAATTVFEALMEHLDEREELERRRRAFARAFVIYQSCQSARDWFYFGDINVELERAGLKARCDGTSATFKEAFAEAEREGLL